jgi:hypothetical protein
MEIIDLLINAAGFSAVDNSDTGASALDSMFLTMSAPANFVISSISFSESGNHNVNGTDGVSVDTRSITIDGMPRTLAPHFKSNTFGVNVPWSIGPIVVPTANKGTIDISTVNSLFAFAAVGGSASVEKNIPPQITVGLTAIPLPPAFLLMGTAIVALAAVKRREEKS